MNLTERERWTIANALRVAAEQYAKDEAVFVKHGPPSLAKQFHDQRIEALALADRVDQDESLEFYQCGICDCYHPRQWNGDCRDDKNRFAVDQLDEKYGPDGWTEVEMP